MKLLLVDDEVTMIQIMEKAIDWKKKGIQKVFVAYNADEARDILASSAIDIMICDIEMPGESGLELIQWMQDAYPEIICIILTGLIMQEARFPLESINTCSSLFPLKSWRR